MNPAPHISLHDVMPGTLTRMEEILRYLNEHAIPPITLLVVPGCEWTPVQIARLRELASVGYEIAAHGWRHRVDKITRPYHRLHSLLISRKVAEHLALDSEQILDLMLRSAAWFSENDLPAPTLYVPPAWALGPLKREHQQQLPYSRIEVLRGFLNPHTGQLEKVPMVGFEADTTWRAFWVRRWNKQQLRVTRKKGLPLRIGIHPNDFRLRMAKDLRELLKASSSYS